MKKEILLSKESIAQLSKHWHDSYNYINIRIIKNYGTTTEYYSVEEGMNYGTIYSLYLNEDNEVQLPLVKEALLIQTEFLLLEYTGKIATIEKRGYSEELILHTNEGTISLLFTVPSYDVWEELS